MITFGTAKINIHAGQSRNVKVHLSAAGRKLLLKRKRATVFTNVSLGATSVASIPVQLKG